MIEDITLDDCKLWSFGGGNGCTITNTNLNYDKSLFICSYVNKYLLDMIEYEERLKSEHRFNDESHSK